MKNLLLVEDDNTLGFVIKDNLETEGYHVIWAKDGEEGKSQINKDFDLIILDVMHPKLDGYTLAETIRKSDKHIPILFLYRFLPHLLLLKVVSLQKLYLLCLPLF